MDPFAAIMLGGVVLLLVALLLLGRFYPGSGAQQLDWRPTRSPEIEVQNEIDDMDQMREAVNRRRRARGEAELTEEDLRERVAEDHAETLRLRRARASPVVRALMVGGGCRGLALARTLVAEGHAVRAVTRSPARRAEIEAAGCECWIGDPDRIGSLRYALDNVTVLLWLLGTATGPNVEALHGSRLRMMLDKTTDTTVRAVLYEAAGTVAPAALEAGAAELALAQTLNEIPGAVLEADPRDVDAWVAGARAAIEHLLSVDRGSARTRSLTQARSSGSRSSRSPTIRAVAPQMTSSPTT